MAEQSILNAVRRTGANAYNSVNLEANEANELFVVQGQPPYSDYVRQGKRYTMKTSTAFAAIVGVPSTTAQLEIYNGHGTLSMVIDTIFSMQILGTAVVWSHTPWAQVGVGVQSAVAALVAYSSNGGASITSAAGLAGARAAVDQTVVASGWEVFPGATMNFGLAAATPGGANVSRVEGRLVVPPGKALHVAVSGSVNTASAFQCGASWIWASLTNA